jgi:hypothetical protein
MERRELSGGIRGSVKEKIGDKKPPVKTEVIPVTGRLLALDEWSYHGGKPGVMSRLLNWGNRCASWRMRGAGMPEISVRKLFLRGFTMAVLP